MGSRQMAGVHPLVDNDARILPQLPGELAISDVDGVNAAGAARQQHVSEAAGRGADVEGCLTIDFDPEVIEGVNELEAPARHPGVVVPLDGKRGIRRELFARLVDTPPAAAVNPGE